MSYRYRTQVLRAALIALSPFVLALACGSSTPAPVVTEPEPESTVDPAGAALFSIDQVPRFDIRLDDAAYAALVAEPKEWVSGTVEYDGDVYENVGVRLKGNHSFRPLGEKASFKLKWNKFERGRRFLGLEALTFNSMVVDSSMLREWISYRVFRELEVPAPRVGFSQIFLNDQEYGLYLTVEPYDDEFLERVYDDAKGNLYESDKSADLDTDVENWDQDEGDDESRDDLKAFSKLALEPGNAVFYGDKALVDMPKFLAFLAGETIVGHFDGHIGGHNFFVYHEPSLDLWSYQPWSLDQGLARHVTAFDQNGYLGYKCLHDGQCLIDYIVASQAALDRLREIDMESEVHQVVLLTDAAMRSDPMKPYSTDAVEAGRIRSATYIAGRADELAPQYECLVDGVQPDADNDGYGPCFQDCDESNAAVNPDAEELCDDIDNNCSGFVDDVPACTCPSVTVEGQTFYLCRNHITWLAARDYCEEQGNVLAHFKSLEQSEEVWESAREIAGGRWSIGLNDRAVENDYRWIDGSSPSFTNWANGQPAHQLGWFDCVFVIGGKWGESNCIEKGSFMCTAP